MHTPLRKLSLSLVPLLMVAVLPGCHHDTPAEQLPAVKITQPTDGQAIKLADDEDPATVGIQFSIKAHVDHVTSSAKATLLINGAESGSQSLSVANNSADVDFAKVTLPAGALTLTVRVDDAGSGKKGSSTVSVTVESGNCTFVSPQDGATLGASADTDPATPGVQAQVKVQCQGVAAGDTATLKVAVLLGANRQDLAPVTATVAADGSATFDKVPLGEGKNGLGFVATSASGTTDGAVSATVTVSTGACPVVITTRNDLIFNAAGGTPPDGGDTRQVQADVDPSAAGIQEDFAAVTDVTVCPAGSTATLAFNGQPSTASATVAADGQILFPHASVPDGDPVTAIVAVSAGAKSGQSVPNVYGVDSVVPQLTITQPNKATLTPADDVDPNTNGLQTNLAMHATAGVDSATLIQVQDTSNNGAPTTLFGPAANPPDANGDISFPQAVTLPSGTNVLTATATRRLGNVGTATFTTNVTQSSLSISLLAPSSTTITCTHAVGDTTDEDLTTSDCDLTMRVQVDPSATTIDFAGTGPQSVTGGQTGVAPDANHQAQVQFHIPQGDGYTLTATAHDSTGATQSVNVTVSVHTVAPTVVFTQPDHSTSTIYGQTQDVTVHVTGAATGQQVVLTSTVGSTTSTISTQSVGTVDANGAADVTFTGANLPLGAQTLTATITDSYGNVGTDFVNLTVVTNGQCDLNITGGSPQVFNIAGTNAETDGGSQRVATITGTTTLCMGQTVTITKTVSGNTTTVGTVTADASTGAWSQDVAFADNEVDATLSASIGAGPQNFAVNVTYTADFTPPSFDTLVPAAGTVLIAPNGDTRSAPYYADADAATAGGQLVPNIVVSGAGRLGTVAETGTGSLVISGPDGTSGIPTITDQAAQTFNTQLTFADGFTRAVTLTATDAAGNSTTATWNVAVASVPLPAMTVVDPSGTLNVFYDLKPFHTDHIDYHAYVTFSSQIGAATEVYVCSTTAAPGATKSCVQASPAGTVDPGSDLTFGGDGGLPLATSMYAADVVFPEGSFSVFAEAINALGDNADSPTKAITVDSVPPKVTSVSVTEDTNQDGILNAQELSASGGVAHVVANFTGVEPGRSATLHDGTAGYTATVSGTLASSTATFSVSGLADGSTHNFKVTVTDAAGNPNETSAVSPPVTNPEDAITIRIATGAPTISVISPTFNVCNLGNGADPNSKTCNTTFQVDVASETGLTVTQVAFGGPGAPTNNIVTPSNGTASAAYRIPEGASQTITATATDSAGNSATASVTLLVDATPPALTITSPTGGTQNGQDFTVSVSTTSSDVSSVTITSSATNPANSSIGTASFSGGVANVSVHAPIDTSSQTLVAVATDAAGNPGSSAPITLHVTQAGCDVQFTNPSGSTVTINKQTPGQNTITVTGNSTQCPSWPVDFFVSVNGGAETAFGSTTTDSSGHFSQAITLQDGAVTTFRAQMVRSAVTNSASFTATVDVTAPTISVTAPQAGPSGTLYVVAQTGNRHVAAGDPGYVADVSSVNGGQVSVSLTINGGGSATGSGNGTLVITDGSGNVLASQTITSNGTVSFSPSGTPLQFTLQQAYQGAVNFKVTDAAGNSTTATWSSVAVDVVPPPAPTLITSDPGDGGYTHLANERHADMVVAFSRPTDDGLPSAPVSLELGYSNSLALDGGSYSDVDYSNSNVTTIVAEPSSPTIVTTLSRIPPLNTYYLAPRAIDSVGNASPFSFSSLSVNWTTETIAYPGTSSTAAAFGRQLAVGDINGDGKADFAVFAQGENNSNGALYVYYGGTFPLSSPQVYAPGTHNFGYGAAIGDLNGDGFDDLAVFDGAATSVYFGSSSGLPNSPSFKVTGATTVGSAITDIDGDGIKDLVLSAPFTNVGGTVYVFWGRRDWSGFPGTVAAADVTITDASSGAQFGGFLDRPLAFASVDGGGGLYVAAPGASKAYVFSGASLPDGGSGDLSSFSPTVFLPPPGQAPSSFGYMGAQIDTNSDGIPDAVFSSTQSNTTLFVATRSADGTFVSTVPFGGTFADAVLALKTGDLTLDGWADLFCGAPGTGSGSVTLFASTAAGGVSASPSGRLWGNAGFGNSEALGDVNGDGKLDLIVGEPSNGNGYVYVFH